MLEFHDTKQNDDDWYQLRCGLLTGSNLGKIMANFGKAFGEPAKKLAVSIAVEQITGQPKPSGYSNEHMERGHEQEPLARMAYEDAMFCTVDNGGFFRGEFVGCSPDGLVGTDGLIEIKSVIDSVHYANIKRASIDPAYRWQCIGNLKFTGRQWLDFVSYCADFPADKRLYVYRIKAADLADEFKQIDSRVSDFRKLVDTTRDKIEQADYVIVNDVRAAA